MEVHEEEKLLEVIEDIGYDNPREVLERLLEELHQRGEFLYVRVAAVDSGPEIDGYVEESHLFRLSKN